MSVRCTINGDDVLTVTLDDGDKNTLTPATFDALIGALDDHPHAVAVVLTGRDGILSAGLDLHWMQHHGRAGVEQLLVRFGTCLMRWWTDPRPTVCVATGHAIAAGTLLAMACDHAVATEGGFWGLTETRIGLEVPDFALALARANLPADRLEDLLLPGARLTAAEAVAAGYADVLAADQEQAMVLGQARTEELAALPARAYAGTKQRLRGTAAAAVMEGLEDDVTVLTAQLG